MVRYVVKGVVEKKQIRPIKFTNSLPFPLSLLRLLVCGYLTTARCGYKLNFSPLTHHTPSELAWNYIVGGERQSLHIVTYTQLPLLCNPDLLLGSY